MTFRRFYKYLLLPLGWFYCQKMLGRFTKGTVRILLYHRVENIRRYPLVIPVETFRCQMAHCFGLLLAQEWQYQPQMSTAIFMLTLTPARFVPIILAFRIK